MTNGDFNTATNWNPAQVPGSSNNVIFEQGTVPINVFSTNSSVNRVNRFTVRDATEVSLSLPTLTGNLIPLQIQGNLYLGPDAGDRAVLRLRTSSMSATSRATLGSGDGWGTWYLDSGTAAFVEGLTMGDSTLSKGSLFLDDAVFNHGSSSTSYVGNFGKGVLELDNGSNFDGDTVFYAAKTGSEATVKVENGSTLDSNHVYIGGTDTTPGGIATIDVMGSSSINGGFSMKIWNGGTVNVLGGSSLQSRTLENAGVLTLNSSSLTLQSPSVASLDNTGTLNLTDSTVTTNRFVNRGSLNVTNTQLTIHNGLFDLGSTPQSLDVDASAFSSIDISGSSASTANIANLYVGRSGSGTLIIEDSASFTNNTAYIGLGSSAVGSVSVSGGASWTNNGSLFVGTNGDGTLNADNGFIQAGNVLVGSNSGSTGSLTLANDSQLHAGTGNFTLGNSGTGSAILTIDETSFLHTGDLDINATGQLDLNGGEIWARSIVNNSGALNFNHGSISIFGGTYDDGSGNLTISSNASANESLLIFGQSATPSYGTVTIGAGNIGKLILQDNATLTSNLARVGSDKGYVTVRNGATWNSNGLFLVGHSINSYGELEIESTAAVTAERMFVGSGSNSSGVLRVTGGSLTVSSAQPDAGLYLGGNFNNPMGAATVFLNGTVDIEDTLKIWNTANLSIAGGSVRAHTIDNAAGGNLSHYGGELIVDGGAFLPGTPSLDVQGSATPTLTLDNGATLNVDQLDIGRSTGDGNLNIRNGSVVTTDSGRVGYSDANTGNVTVEGAGSTWTTQSLTFTGFFGQGNSHLAIDSGGSVVVAGDFEIVGGSFTATNGGTLEVGSLSKGENTTAAISDSGTTTALTIGAGGGSSSFNGTIADAAGGPGSITKTGTGSLELTGANTYTGGTRLDGGTLLVNNTTGSGTGSGLVTANSGGILGGDGTIGGNVVVNTGGTLAPGNSTGTLTIGGDLTLAGLTVIEIASDSIFDQINVGNDLTYGGDILFGFSYLPQPTDSFDIFDFGGAQSGNFANINFSDPNFAGTFDYTTGTLSLTAVPEPEMFGLLAGLFGLGLAAIRRRKR